MEIAVITVSDRSYNGIREDKTGPILIEYLESKGNKVFYELVPDDIRLIKKVLTKFIKKSIPLILTNGGTGFAKRDVTPEATKKVIKKEAPGIMEYIRMENSKNSINSYLSRGICGIKNKTIILNLPGSPQGALQCYKIVEQLIEHGINLINENIKDCQTKN
ncbi:MAG TPA: MogA/MoaB family molybdenum cofactor biosynthesis protein [Spirochaetota bacterium]|nr:MogA/MoaB family molybdenum cofactor biosynthesis protein [Spirochaetota bacterium]